MTLLDAIAPASQRAEANGGKTDLAKLATRIQDDLIQRNQGEDYAAHHVITQLLLLAVGPFSFERVDIIRGDVLSRNKAKDKPSFSDEHSTVILRNVVVGATYRLTCTVDGRREVVEQTGDVEHPENWQHDAARLKDAESDALKRCAMRFGLGLHLWAQEHYRLDAWLATREQQAADVGEQRGDRGGFTRSRGGAAGRDAEERRSRDVLASGAPAKPRYQRAASTMASGGT